MRSLPRPIRRVLVSIAGAALLALGLVLLVLPGPGLLFIGLALFVLALEFEWAKRAAERFARLARRLGTRRRPARLGDGGADRRAD